MKGYYGSGIEYYRKMKGMPLKELAAILNMSRQNLTEIERNRRTIQEDKIQIIAKSLNTTVEALKSYHPDNLTVINKHIHLDVTTPMVQVPESAWAALEATIQSLQDTLKSVNESHRTTKETLEITQEALLKAHRRITELEKESR